jgi:hypothetical protein
MFRSVRNPSIRAGSTRTGNERPRILAALEWQAKLPATLEMCTAPRENHAPAAGIATMSKVTLTEPESRDLSCDPHDPQAPLCVLRRLLAESLQSGYLSADQALACMRCLDAADQQACPHGCEDREKQCLSRSAPVDLDELQQLCNLLWID